MNGWPSEYLYAIAAIVGILAISRCEVDQPVVRIEDVEAVVVEGRQRPDDAAHHRHRVGIAPEPAKNACSCSFSIV